MSRDKFVTEKFVDPLETADAYNAIAVNEKLAEAAVRVKPEFHPEFDGESCVGCGESIAPGRLALGKVRCVRCQSRRDGTRFVPE